MRVLLAIGCDRYEYVSHLSGAELDARRVFDKLISPTAGAYDESASHLLLSPTSEDIRGALRRVLIINEEIEELTIYFAGHGCVVAGSFYMITRDARQDALSMTAISLSDVLRAVAESKSKHTNILIDACQSGGLVEDLGTILKGSIVGRAETPGVTLFAASASDQYAKEDSGGGFATKLLVDCIDGNILVRDDVPTLELTEIGRTVSARLEGSGQTPVIWGLNLHGASRFCSNPFYSKGDVDLRMVLTKRCEDKLDLTDTSASLWQLYYSVPNDWDCRRYIDLLRGVFDGREENLESASDVVYRFCLSSLSRSESSEDALLPIEVLASSLCVLMKWIEHPAVQAKVLLISQDLIRRCKKACDEIAVQLDNDEYAILRGGRGLPDLFYLPIRTFTILGWLSLSLYDDISLGMGGLDSSDYQRICRRLLDVCNGAFSAISEEQAPFIVSTVHALEIHGAKDSSEEMLGYLFGSAIDCEAMFSDCGITGRQAFSYIFSRASCDISGASDSISNPSELLTVLLKLGDNLDLGDVMDRELWRIDYRSCISFVSSNARNFAEDRMIDGDNKIWTVGRDLFRISDLRNGWSASGSLSNVERFCAVCAAFIMKDRVPWFLVDEIERRPS